MCVLTRAQHTNLAKQRIELFQGRGVLADPKLRRSSLFVESVSFWGLHGVMVREGQKALTTTVRNLADTTPTSTGA